MLLTRALSASGPSRVWPVYLMAASVPISMAATSIAKFLILITGCALIFKAIAQQRQFPILYRLSSVKVLFILLFALFLSIFYGEAPTLHALGDWGKYAKLIILPLVLILVRDSKDAFKLLSVILIVQGLVVVSSCFLAAGVPLPWVRASRNATTTVFSSYLDQAIMTAGFATVCWHLRLHSALTQRPVLRWVMVVMVGLAVFNVLALLPGRSGQVAMIAAVCFAAWWTIPRKHRVWAALIPILLTVAALATPSKFQDRMGSGINEVNEYYVNNNTNTSIGIRLNFWHRAAQAIADRPLLGHGVGSWQQQFLRLVEPTTKGANPHNNPHQEYLQMGVQLGLGGIGLLIAFIVYLAKDANPMATPLRFATQSLALVFAVACLFNCSLFDALIGDYFCLLFGILFACGQNAALGETPDLAQMPLKI